MQPRNLMKGAKKWLVGSIITALLSASTLAHAAGEAYVSSQNSPPQLSRYYAIGGLVLISIAAVALADRSHAHN